MAGVRITTLDHKTGNDTAKSRCIIKRIANKAIKIAYCHRRNCREKFNIGNSQRVTQAFGQDLVLRLAGEGAGLGKAAERESKYEKKKQEFFHALKIGNAEKHFKMCNFFDFFHLQVCYNSLRIGPSEKLTCIIA